MVSTLQNTVVEYSTLTLTYLLIVGIVAQAIGIYSFWWAQRRFVLGTKTMFNTIAVGIIVLDGWGMVGIWQQHFGFHNKWEFWLYQVFYGRTSFSLICRDTHIPLDPTDHTPSVFVCPCDSYSQIMISEGKKLPQTMPSPHPPNQPQTAKLTQSFLAQYSHPTRP